VVLDFNWQYNIDLICGGFLVLDGTENQLKAYDYTACMHARKVTAL